MKKHHIITEIEDPTERAVYIEDEDGELINVTHMCLIDANQLNNRYDDCAPVYGYFVTICSVSNRTLSYLQPSRLRHVLFHRIEHYIRQYTMHGNKFLSLKDQIARTMNIENRTKLYIELDSLEKLGSGPQDLINHIENFMVSVGALKIKTK